MKKTIALCLLIILLCAFCSGCAPVINNGTEDILYNGIVYERYGYMDYNIEISEEHAFYIGDFVETYKYGQELPWEVYAMNEDADILYTAYMTWLKPGYEVPKYFGEEFSSVEYVIPHGINFAIIPDDYSEEVTPLKDFEGSVKLEDIIKTDITEVTEYTEHNCLRFFYKNHRDLRVLLDICSADGKYYLNVRYGDEGFDELHEIKPEYVELLTSAIPDDN